MLFEIVSIQFGRFCKCFMAVVTPEARPCHELRSRERLCINDSRLMLKGETWYLLLHNIELADFHEALGISHPQILYSLLKSADNEAEVAVVEMVVAGYKRLGIE